MYVRLVKGLKVRLTLRGRKVGLCENGECRVGIWNGDGDEDRGEVLIGLGNGKGRKILASGQVGKCV